MKQFFTTQEVASILKVTRMAVRNWIIKGRLTATLTPGGHRRVEREELERFLVALGYSKNLIDGVTPSKPSRRLFCWEYHAKGFVKSSHLHNCEICLAARSRSLLCHVLRLDADGLLGCRESCADCSYHSKYGADFPES